MLEMLYGVRDALWLALSYYEQCKLFYGNATHLILLSVPIYILKVIKI